nr:cytochrome P450 [Chloroflexia bacterium]
PLARIEGQVAFTTLLNRLPGLRLDAPRDALRWRQGSLIRGVETLTVAF